VEGAHRLVPTVIRLAGRNITRQATARSCLVLSPHPDDETLGCGATIARKRRAGTPVQVLVASDGRYSTNSARVPPSELARMRRREFIRACGVLGVGQDDLILLDLEDGSLSESEDVLTECIGRVLERTRPEELYVTSPSDPHPDHSALGRAAFRAAAGVEVDVLTYPIWQWPFLRPWLLPSEVTLNGVDRSLLAAWRTRPLLVRSADYQAVKRRALAEYESQLRNVTGEDAWWVLDAGFVRHFLRGHEVFFRPVLGGSKNA
jgi:LmbE family N-acetylglucosaminyl deacetylase